jgi:hypothetical protein
VTAGEDAFPADFLRAAVELVEWLAARFDEYAVLVPLLETTVGMDPQELATAKLALAEGQQGVGVAREAAAAALADGGAAAPALLEEAAAAMRAALARAQTLFRCRVPLPTGEHVTLEDLPARLAEHLAGGTQLPH